MSIYMDLSEFLSAPMRTGIQRISGEICKYAPPNALIPIRLCGDHFIELPVELITAIAGYFNNTNDSGVAEIMRLAAAENRPQVKISSSDTILIPEIFGEERAAFMSRLPEELFRRCRFILFDLLPFTHPEYFPPEAQVWLSAYFRVARLASCCGFISDYTRDVYFNRLRRTACVDGRVLTLGSDALGGKAERLVLDRPLSFSVLGTVEPRKNHALILEAFEPLLKEIEGLTLTFIGKIGWIEPGLAKRIRDLAADEKSGFRLFSEAGDDVIRHHIEQSRATIYVSAAEGYGLPPVESLWVGTPVIASSTVPSLTRLGSEGIHYVEPLTAINLRCAVLAFLDNSYANQKTREAFSIELPTWKSFTGEVMSWCQET